MDDEEAFVHRFTQYPEEVLRAQDGNTVPFTLNPGGPVIGRAEMKYVEGVGLEAHFYIDDPKLVELLKGPPPSIS